MKRLVSVLFWSVIAAAFIGPGTVTTAASAGAAHGTALLWALGFSTLACMVLQEAAGRLRLLSGRSLGQALSAQFPQGGSRWLMLLLVVGAVLIGNAAYEAGNILGGVAGASLLVGWPTWVLTLVCGGLAAALLWGSAPGRVAQVLGLVVAVMGVSFLAMAVALRPPITTVVRGLTVPSLPAGSGLLVLGLVGTTVVPYNLFLGSGLKRQEDLSVFRFGLAVAVGLGGVISMAILVVGTQVAPPFSFAALESTLVDGLGSWAGVLFAIGLFCAGLSSAITAPLASALTARSLFGRHDEDERWAPDGLRYRAVWGSILAVGLVFGMSGVRPIPVIILAQALNGIVLPAVAVFLLVVVNDRGLMGDRGLNRWLSNSLMVAVTLVASLLGTMALLRVAEGLGIEWVDGLDRLVSALPWVSAPSRVATAAAVVGLLFLTAVGPMGRVIRQRRVRSTTETKESLE